jgi:hypothetical protein
MFPDILKGIPTVEEMRDVKTLEQNNSNNEIKNTVDSMKERLKNKSPAILVYEELSNTQGYEQVSNKSEV